MPTPEELAKDKPKRTEVKFTRMDELIGKWYLEDGTIITFRTVALRATREDSYHPDGSPVYHISNKLFMEIDAPGRLHFDIRKWDRDDGEDDDDFGAEDEETFRRAA